MTMNEHIEDIRLSFMLFEFSIRTMCYAELEKFDVELFGQDLQINLAKENVSYRSGKFNDQQNIIRSSQMAVGAAFGCTAICLDCALEKQKNSSHQIQTLKALVSAVRNAFSHGIAAPSWYVKEHKQERLNLDFIQGPIVDLGILNGQPFDYEQIGGLATWYRINDYVIKSMSSAHNKS